MTTASRLPLAALALGLSLAACTDWAGYDIDVAAGKVPQLATMRRNVIPDPYGMVRLPAPHTVPVQSPMGDLPEHFSSDKLDSVAATLVNPYAHGAPPAVLARGQFVFHNNCYVCHGPAGAGDGPVVKAITDRAGKSHPRFPFAPPLNGANTAARSDGYIYGVLSAGRGLMPSYGFRVTNPDRWAVVEYVRSLQVRAGQTPQRGGANTGTVVQPPSAATPGGPAATPAPATTPAPAPAAPAQP